MTEQIPCRFADKGCKSPATAILYAPKGCICWPDVVQALCAQHQITMESTGPIELIVVLDEAAYWGAQMELPLSQSHAS